MSNSPPTPLDDFFAKAVQDPTGATLPPQPTLQLAGAGVTVTDDPVNGRTVATFAGVVKQQSWVEANGTTGNITLTTAQTGNPIRTDTTGGDLDEVTLPSPTALAAMANGGDGCSYTFVNATNQWAANPLTVNGNGNPVRNPATVNTTGQFGTNSSVPDIVVLDTGASVTFIYDKTNVCWQVG